MAIRVTCQSCDHEFTTRDDKAGRRVKCPECSEPVAVIAKRKGKSKNKTGGNQTLLIAGIAGGVAIAALVVVVVLMTRGGGNNVQDPNVAANNPAPMMGAAPNGAMPQPAGAVPNGMPGAPGASMPPTTAAPTGSVPGALPPAANPYAAVPGGTPTTAGVVTPQTTPGIAGTTAPGTVPVSPMPVASAPGVGVPGATAPGATVPGGGPANFNNPNGAGVRPAEMQLTDLITRCEPSVVRINVETADGEKGTGSGFVVSTDGIIVTNYHVIEGAVRASCAFKDGTQANVEGFLKVDPKRDVAIIKINRPADKLFPLKIGKVLPRKGEKVVAFGAPLGLDWTVTEGIISAFRSKPELAKLGIVGLEGDWIQTSTPISPGNSGGPLVSYTGEVVAMNTMQFTVGQNLNFAVQAKEIELVLEQSKGAQLVALAPAALPKVSKSRSPKVIDATKDERGKKALGRLQEVTLLLVMSRDPTGRIRAIVQKKAIDTAKQLGLLVRDGDESDNELMVVTMHFEDSPTSKVGAFEVHVSAVVLMRNTNEEGQLEILKVWDKEEKLGTVQDRLFLTGEIPKSVLDKLSSFFGKFKGTLFTARREADKAKSGADDKSKSKGGSSGK